ncbi:hypothetical protein GCM10009844_39040 [Nocardioides koreensis]|uniref:PKD domain-containing protein n=1 Tax=Nocardioides koreensis TaxID=433651 RepID=A0ABN3A4T6_9ACTN
MWFNADQEKTPIIAPLMSVEQSFDGRTVTMEVAATPGPGRRIVGYIWEFVDGAITRGSDLRTVQHTYTEPGEYLVSVAVKDDKGCWGVGHGSTTVVVE